MLFQCCGRRLLSPRAPRRSCESFWSCAARWWPRVGLITEVRASSDGARVTRRATRLRTTLLSGLCRPPVYRLHAGTVDGWDAATAQRHPLPDDVHSDKLRRGSSAAHRCCKCDRSTSCSLCVSAGYGKPDEFELRAATIGQSNGRVPL